MTVFIYYVSKTHPRWCVYSSLVWNMHSVPLCDYATINTPILLSKGIWILSSVFFLCSFGNSAENILDIYVSWSLSTWLSMEYIPWSGVIGSNCFSEWLDPFMFHSLEFLLHSIPSLRCGGVLPLSSSIPNLSYLCWWSWGHSHLSQPDPMMFLKPQWTCEMFLCIPMLLAEHKRGNDRLEIDWVHVTIRIPGSFWRMKATG